MNYAQNKFIHDADSHLMEFKDCLNEYLTADQLHIFKQRSEYRVSQQRQEWMNEAARKHRDPEFRSTMDGREIMLRKNYEGFGSFIREDRPKALDLLGVASQIVFTTYCLGNFNLERDDDVSFAYVIADAHNRMITDYCSIDSRLLPIAYIPLEDIDMSIASAKLALELGAKGLMIPSLCPRNHSPSHTGLFPIWEMAQDAGVPILFHIGGEEKLRKSYKVNGLPAVPDFQGGDDNFTSISYMAIPNAVMISLASLVIDGIFDKFQGLKWGAIELGASWVPGWMRSLDSCAKAFGKNEERIKNLSAIPSEIIKRQFRVTPYPHEDVGWLIKNTGPDMALFSTDFPHTEGGRDPIKRFEASLDAAQCTQQERDGFYHKNYIDLMGRALPQELRYPKAK